MRQRIARTHIRAFCGSAVGGALIGASSGLYAGREGVLVGALVGTLAGLLAGLGIIRTKAWGDARNRELDRYIVGPYEPRREPNESLAAPQYPVGT